MSRIRWSTAVRTTCILTMAAAGGASVTASTAAASVVPAPATAAAHCAERSATITLANNNKTLCVTAGTIITVLLRGPSGSNWERITTNSSVLAPRIHTQPKAQAGVTGAEFVAARPGKAFVSSIRFVCSALAAPSAVGSGAGSCFAIVKFHATVIVDRNT